MDNKSKGANYLKYSGLAVQFVLTILVMVYLGQWLDDYLGLDTPWFTLLGSILGLAGSMTYLIVRVGRDK